tara:strand:+ start:2924 stop:4195 length:1272 start_codon:yes stop_codon:yes gene_type:complete
MVNRLANYLIIDWGFTRFKLWFLDENRKIIKDSFSNIKDISKNPQFYTKKDLDNIFAIILKFIKELDLEGKDLVIFNSCQMHGIAGLFANSEPFFSTWNDLPNKYKETSVKSINGNPSLISMPNNKLSSDSKYLLFFSEFIKNNISNEPIKVKRLMTPFQLIYNYYFEINVPTSKYLWESTCAKESFLNEKIDKIKPFSESSYKLKKSKFFKNVREIQLFPEIGDLQASTFSSINNSDIVFNWGTGSQIIFNNSFSSKTEFYRDFPKLGNLPVISHIPCGRLINEYCSNTIYDFKDIIEELKTLNYINFLNIIEKSKKDLLFFPGFDVNKFEYTNVPKITIKDIITYSPSELLCNWLNQYKIIVETSCPESKNTSPIKVTISGQLGGISTIAIKLLNKIFPNNFDFNLSESELAKSLLECAIY